MWGLFILKSVILIISKGWIKINILCNVDSEASFQYDLIYFTLLLLCHLQLAYKTN
jgi:hypothetical protein